MRSRKQHRWQGQSGELYTYDVYEWPIRLSSGPGNYILARCISPGEWQPVLIGECDDLSALVDDGRLRNGFVRDGVTHIHVRPTLNPATIRRREVGDLAAQWNLPVDPF